MAAAELNYPLRATVVARIKVTRVGHLFVAQGDLTNLAFHALLIPCDSGLNVSKVWRGILPPDLPRGDSVEWLRLPGHSDAYGVVTLPDNANRRVRAFVAVETAAWSTDAVRSLTNSCNVIAWSRQLSTSHLSSTTAATSQQCKNNVGLTLTGPISIQRS